MLFYWFNYPVRHVVLRNRVKKVEPAGVDGKSFLGNEHCVTL